LIEYFKDFGFDKEQILDVDRILFADFTGNRDAEIKPYIQIDDLQGLVNKMDQFQEEYNNDISFIVAGPRNPMKLVMFLDAT
jgi:dynein heavy chain